MAKKASRRSGSRKPKAPPQPQSPDLQETDAVSTQGLLAAVGVFAAMTVFFACMARRQPSFGDTPELMTVAVNLGIAHPTGYPLLTILGRAASLVPVSTVAWRLGFLVGLVAALAAGGMCLLVHRAFGSVWAAIVAGLVLGLTPVLWENGTRFEVYTLNAFFIVSVVLLASMVWSREGLPPRIRGRYLYLTMFTAGLGLSHHLTFIAILPAAAWIALRNRGIWLPKRRQIWLGVLTFVLGLTPWLYLPIRGHLPYDPYTCWASLDNLDALIGHMTARQYGPRLLAYSVPAVPMLARRDLGALWEQFGPLLVLIPFGFLALKKRAREVIEGGLVLIVINLTLFFGYAVGDYDVFFVPTYIGLCILLGAGVAWLTAWLATMRCKQLAFIPALIAIVLLAVQLPGRYARLRPSPESFPMDYVHKLADSVPRDAVIVFGGQWNNLDSLIFPLIHAKRVAGEIPELTFRTAGRIEKPKAARVFLDEIQASDQVTREVLAAPEEDRVSAFLRDYDGDRPLFTDSPELFQNAGLGGAYCGYVWRVLPQPGFKLEATPADFVRWVRAQATRPGADESVHDNLATPLLNYAHYLVATGRNTDAQEFAELTASICNKASEPYVIAAMAASKAANSDTAWKLYHRLLRTQPYSSRTYLVKGVLLLNEKQYRRALSSLDVAHAVDRISDDDDIAYARAACYLSLGDRDRARKAAGPKVWPRILQALEAQDEGAVKGDD